MFCRKCGQKLMDSAAFCSNCGTACITPAQMDAQQPEMEVPPVEELIAQPMGQEIFEEIPVQEPVEMAEESVDQEPAETVEEMTVQAEPVWQPEAEPVWYPEAEPVWYPEAEPVWEPQAAPVYQPPQPEKPPVKRKKRPSLGVRFVMQLLSFLLCLVLVATLVAGVAVMDLRRLTSSDGLKKVLDEVLFKTSAEHTTSQIPNGYSVMHMSDIDIDIDDVPGDILGGGNGEENMDALVEWLYDALTENMEDVQFTEEDLAKFVEESTVGDYLSEKLAGFAEDVLNGTENTEITSDEIMDLLEENERELKQELNVELSAEDKRQLKKDLEQIVEEEDLNNTIRQTVSEEVDATMQESLGVDLDTIQTAIRTITSTWVLLALLGVILLLIGLLLLVNYYNLGAGLTWSASAGLLVGLVVALPLLLRNVLIELLIPEGGGGILSIINAFASALTPIHYGLLIISFVLLVGSIVIRCISRSRRKRQILAAAA